MEKNLIAIAIVGLSINLAEAKVRTRAEWRQADVIFDSKPVIEVADLQQLMDRVSKDGRTDTRDPLVSKLSLRVDRIEAFGQRPAGTTVVTLTVRASAERPPHRYDPTRYEWLKVSARQKRGAWVRATIAPEYHDLSEYSKQPADIWRAPVRNVNVGKGLTRTSLPANIRQIAFLPLVREIVSQTGKVLDLGIRATRR